VNPRTPCLPANLEAWAGTSRNVKIHNHFAAVGTPPAARRVTFSSAIFQTTGRGMANDGLGATVVPRRMDALRRR